MRALIIAFCFFLHASVQGAAADGTSDFETANRLYEKGDYGGAIGGYQKL